MRRARSARSIRETTDKILRENNVERPPVPVDRIAEALGAKLRYSPFDGELAGMLIRDNNTVVIGVNSLHHPNRQRFTIAHECGHLMLHKARDVHIDRSFRVNRRDQVSSQATDAEEIEANRFAAELLMPHEMIMSDVVAYDIDIENEEELKELADKYEVSVQAMTHRITNLLNDIF